MSKRFGRNQKRKLIADRNGLAELVKREASQVSQLRHLMRENEETIRLVEKILGSNFFGLPPRDFQVAGLGRGVRLPSIEIRTGGYLGAQVEPICLQEKLFILQETEYSEHYDRLRNARHFRFKTPAGDVAYAATEDAWNGFPQDEFRIHMRKEIAESMAQFLATNRRKV